MYIAWYQPTDFEGSGHTFSAGVTWNMLRLNTEQISDWLVYVAPSRSSPGDVSGHKIASEAILQYQIQKKILGGAFPQTP